MVVGRDQPARRPGAAVDCWQIASIVNGRAAGVGKTTLAILLGYDERVRTHFRDGVLWAGLGTNPDIASIQAAWADAVGANLDEVSMPAGGRSIEFGACGKAGAGGD
ncbi:MAG: hypothetical protein IPK16_27095 [Anaerolineales bacterium]|nr:hypothetical protein [Anaerolineales bacterium]